MRDLVLLRGIPCSGKSSFIQTNKILLPFTIEVNAIRLLFQSKLFDCKTGKYHISRDKEKNVFEFLKNIITSKMQNGEFIVLDDCNITIDDWIIKSADRFNYRIRVINFDIGLELCLERNRVREEYKQVADQSIIDSYELYKDTILPDNISIFSSSDENVVRDLIYDQPIHVDDYENIVIFGDIHGCFHPLNEYFTQYPFDEKNLYVFVGDYLDRGLQNKEVLEFLINLSDYNNVIFLEGNHSQERLWAKGIVDVKKTREFSAHTQHQIAAMDKKIVTNFTKQWREYVSLIFDNRHYFISHAGFDRYYSDIALHPTRDFIRGSGYSDDIDSTYENSDSKPVQIHGHRNLFQHPMDKFSRSINLCEPVEFGGYLRVLMIARDGKRNYLRFKNDIYRSDEQKNGTIGGL